MRKPPGTRLAVFARKQGDEVFLLAGGVDVASLDSPRFAIRALLEELTALGGRLLACGTCIKLRHAEE